MRYFYKNRKIQPGVYSRMLLRFTAFTLLCGMVINIGCPLIGFPSGVTGRGREDVCAEDIIRLHVRANSNSPQDQALKNYLAGAIVSMYKPLWSRCGSIEELRSLLLGESKTIETAAAAILREKGCAHDVKVSFGKDIFPARFYEGKLYPSGEYEALIMIIGEGGGENWWCVLFPPLCFNLLPSPSLNITSAGEAGGGASGSKDAVQEKAGPNGMKGNGKVKIRSWLWDTFFKKK